MNQLSNILHASGLKAAPLEKEAQKQEAVHRQGALLISDGLNIESKLSQNPNAVAARKYAAKNKEAIKARSKKYCDKNKDRLKERSELYYKKNKEKIKSKRRAYFHSHKEQEKAYRKHWREKNPDYNNRYMCVWRKIPNHHKKIVEFMRNYNARPENKKRQKEWCKNYYQTTQFKVLHRVHCQKRRARKTENRSQDANAQIKRIVSSKTVACFYCGKKISGREAHCDHVKPLVNGGAHSAFNIVPSCQQCNLRKHAKHPNEFVASQLLLIY